MYIYHGTNKINAMSILKTGFKAGTYFSPYLGTALNQGGEYVFEVWLDEELDKDCWQFQIEEDWPISRIAALVHYSAELLYVNDNVNVRESWQKETCEACNGAGEIYRNTAEANAVSYLPKTHFLHMQGKLNSVLCKECNGYGDLEKAREMAK